MSARRAGPAGGERAWLAVDLGAGSGRVMLGRASDERIRLDEVHRFRSPARRARGHLRWDFEELWAGVRAGLRRAVSFPGFEPSQLASLGVDAWGVDYGWIDGKGELLADPIAYRDERTQGMLEHLFDILPREQLYARTGIQLLPINTLVQLLAELRAGELPAGATSLAMIPDLVHGRLCVSTSCERTNASTTQLLSIAGRDWDRELAAAIGLDARLLPELVDAPACLGALRPELARELGLPSVPIVSPATHDTASAVAGTPLEDGWAYVSSGTWSLVGVELAQACFASGALAANLTNEAGIGGTTRLLANVMGLWILEGCRSSWERAGLHAGLDTLLAGLDADDPGEVFIDPDDLRFLAPRDMDREVRTWLGESGQAFSGSPQEITRIVLVSLALRYAEAVQELEAVTGLGIRGLWIVGGGSRNEFLNQATANACGLTVRAGPVEATALGNVLVQAMGDGHFSDLASARRALAGSFPARDHEPRAEEAWSKARENFCGYRSRGGSP
jgi:rhamnulokinase